MDFEYEYNIRGLYCPHFFYMHLNCDFSDDFTLLSTKSLGTFAHEYTHYLQNLTTVYGLQNTNYYLNFIGALLIAFRDMQKIKIPLCVNEIDLPTPICIARDRYMLVQGHVRSESFDFDNCEINISQKTLGHASEEIVAVTLYKDDKELTTFDFGSRCVKEGMAFYIQRRIDSDVELTTLPYHAIDIVIRKVNPSVLEDESKVLALCMLALNAQNVGKAFLEFLEVTKATNSLSAIEFYTERYHDQSVRQKGELLSMREFTLQSLKDFGIVVRKYIGRELEYFNLVIDNIRLVLEKDNLPLLEHFTDRILAPSEFLRELVNHYGFPGVGTSLGRLSAPPNESGDFMHPEFQKFYSDKLTLERIFGMYSGMCSSILICERSVGFKVDEYCWKQQWQRQEPCFFKVSAGFWQIDDKLEEGEERDYRELQSHLCNLRLEAAISELYQTYSIDVDQQFLWQILITSFDCSEIPAQLFSLDLKEKQIVQSALDFFKSKPIYVEFEAGVFIEENFTDDWIEKARVTAGGQTWVIYKYDADPLPSNPHAHLLGSSIKLHLGTGKFYKKNKELKNGLSKKELKKLRRLFEVKAPKIKLPNLEV